MTGLINHRALPVNPRGEDQIDNERRYRAEVERSFSVTDDALRNAGGEDPLNGATERAIANSTSSASFITTAEPRVALSESAFEVAGPFGSDHVQRAGADLQIRNGTFQSETTFAVLMTGTDRGFTYYIGGTKYGLSIGNPLGIAVEWLTFCLHGLITVDDAAWYELQMVTGALNPIDWLAFSTTIKWVSPAP